MKEGRIIIVSGPSGVGKGTVLRRVIASGVIAESTTWSVSIISTARVLLPKLASMSMARSFASCTSRLTGAESGLTTVSRRRSETRFP